MNDQNDFDDELDPWLIEELTSNIEPVDPPTERKQILRANVLDQFQPANIKRFTDLLTIHASEGKWISIGRGVKIKNLFADKDARTHSILLRMEAGASLPGHQHFSHEECIVLEGELLIGDTVLRTGDYHLAPRGVPHGDLYSSTGVLLFLRADTSHPASWGIKLLKHSITSFFSRG